jgi:CRISPR-associated protein Cas2
MGKIRFMRVIVMFDLPTITVEQKREYRRFRKWLIKDGFIMMQMSVYSKIVLNENSVKLLEQRIKEKKTKEGIIQILVLTEKQYSEIEYVQGVSSTDVINTMDKVVIL